jgi:hypothetical protein
MIPFDELSNGILAVSNKSHGQQSTQSGGQAGQQSLIRVNPYSTESGYKFALGWHDLSTSTPEVQIAHSGIRLPKRGHGHRSGDLKG